MIPIENATGGAAFVFHNKTEGTPYKDTDKVAYIEKHADQKENSLINDFCKIKGSNDSKEQNPEKKHLVCTLCSGGNVFFQYFLIYFILNRLESVFKQLHRAKGDSRLLSHRDNLRKHIKHPYAPKKMQWGEGGKKLSSLKHIVCFGIENKK